ncbi:hypothetical protein [Bacillus massiliglaciei]|uniref:hypothetical protein n=1 Tax=Bacillus massiliglaciei TaxID=1816693 RepID=UPI0018FE49DA|nr:hypothetical protein [Bacillus massiliglaciei]
MQYLKYIGVLFISVLLTGCVDATAHVNIHKDGSADLNMETTVNSEVDSIAGPAIEEMIDRQLSGDGYKVSSSNGTIRVSKHFSSMEDMNEGGGNSQVMKDFTVIKEDHFFYKTYQVDGEIDLASQMNSQIEEVIDNSFVRSLITQNLEQADLNLVVQLPVKLPTESNADEVSGKTLTWNISTTESTPIELKVSAPNVTAIAAAAGAVIVVLILAIIWNLRRKKRKAENHE